MKKNLNKNLARTSGLSTAASCVAQVLAAALPFAAVSLQAEDAPSHFNALFNVEFANEYVTPRGMIVRDQGLTVQPLFLGFLNLYKGDGFITDLTLDAGVWNDLGTKPVSVNPPYGSKPTTPWTEIDPIAGFSVGLGKQFTLSVTYTAFAEQILAIGTSQHLETKLAFDDTPYLKKFALHPYFLYWQELDGKATDADVPQAVFGPSAGSGSHPAPGSSHYFEVGVAPSYTLEKCGVKLELPLRMLLPDERFYGNYYAKSSTIGILEAGVKISMPLKFIPQGYGHWSSHVGFKYMYFVDDNLYHLNVFNAPGKPTRDTFQVYAGISTFF